MDVQGNRGWERSTSASRRAVRRIRWFHQSKAVIPNPDKDAARITPWIVAPVKGVTYDVGRNAAKRAARARRRSF